MAITQLLHASLLVTDLARSQQFYEQILGLEAVERPFSFPGVWYQIGLQQLHLIQSDQIVPDLVNAEKWGRNRHVAFAVTHLDSLRKTLQDHGYPVQMSASGRVALFTQDPDGNIVELTQLSP